MGPMQGLPVTFDFVSALYLIPVAVVLVAAISLLTGRVSRGCLRRFGNESVLRRFSCLRGGRARSSVYAALILVFLLLALAEPAIPKKLKRIERTFNYIAVIDVSRSMDAEDYPSEMSRIAMARRTLDRLMDDYKGAVGLVLFTRLGNEFEPTTDHNATRFLIRYAAVPGRAEGEGSNIGKGLEKALWMADEFPEVKTIILMSDGGDGSLAPVRGVCGRLAERGIRVLAVGLGSGEAVPIPNRDPETRRIVSYHYLGESRALTRLTETSLIAIARATGGDYVRIPQQDGERALSEIAEKKEYASSESFGEDDTTPLARWCLVPVLLILVIWGIDKRFVGTT